MTVAKAELVVAVYRTSARWTVTNDEPRNCRSSCEYPGHFLDKRITNAGTFRFSTNLLFIANALKQHHIGLEETGDGIWSIYFGTVLLAKVDEREMVIRD